MKLYVFIITLSFFAHASIIPMEISRFERWLQRWAHKKVLHNLKDQKTPGELTPEGLAFILLTFPPEMQCAIARYIEIPGYHLIDHIKRHIPTIATNARPHNTAHLNIQQVTWTPQSQSLQLILPDKT